MREPDVTRATCLVAFCAVLILACAGQRAAAEDMVEKTNGQKIRGEVTARTDAKVTIRMTMGGSSVEMGFRMKDVHAITVGGERKVYNEKKKAKPRRRPVARAPRPTRPKPAPASRPRASKTPKPAPAVTTRTQAEVQALIQSSGTAKPSWWSSVGLNYPKTLDLSFPKPQQKGWFPQKNVGHYMHSVINENPSRWQQGTKFMHYVLSVNKGNSAVERKCQWQLGGSYHNLLRDWARGAYWWQKVNDGKPYVTTRLAECYWKLGNKAMAAQMLGKIRQAGGNGTAIKLWSDMGDLNRAMSLAAASIPSRWPSGIHVAAGDACRKHGQYQQAIAQYQKTLALPDLPKNKNGGRKRNKARATAAIQNIKVFETLDLSKVRSGTYAGKGVGFGGDIFLSVTVRSGKIADISITKQTEKQFFTSLRDTPKRIIDKQGLKGVDATTGASVTSEAILNATAEALAKGM